MSNWKEANFGFQEFAVRFQFIPNKKGSTNSVTEISKTFELSEQRHVRKSKNFIGLVIHLFRYLQKPQPLRTIWYDDGGGQSRGQIIRIFVDRVIGGGGGEERERKNIRVLIWCDDGYLQEYSQEMKKELTIDKIPNRRVSIFTPGWEISVGVKTTNLSQLILKEWKKKKHEQYFYKHHTRLKIQRLKYKIKYSKSNWSKSIAMGKLSKLKVFRLNLQANGWQAWRKDEKLDN
ncbi:unnamed protein product [Malus baccata var. baccata]